MNKINLLMSLVKLIDYVVPKREKNIIFFSRPDYSDNCRAIYEKLIENTGDKYKITWVVQDIDKLKSDHPKIKFVKHRSLRSLWEMCRAHYIFRTHSFWGEIYVPNRQVMCYAFHGMGIKGFEYDIKDQYARNSFDNFTVTSQLFAQMFADNLNADVDRFIITGLPRNDYLFVQPLELLDKLGLDSFDKRIIWMPTFRTNKLCNYTNGVSNESGLPVITKHGLNIMDKILSKNNYCLIIKLHQWAAESIQGMWNNIKVLTDFDIPQPYTLYHLLGLMDVLLTDYSSVSTDFLLLNRPIGYVFDDLEEYKKTRYLPLDPIENLMAGAKIHTESDLFKFIENIDNDSFENERERVAELFLKDRDDNSSERVLKAIGLI